VKEEEEEKINVVCVDVCVEEEEKDIERT
jgi:hypothetical protein